MRVRIRFDVRAAFLAGVFVSGFVLSAEWKPSAADTGPTLDMRPVLIEQEPLDNLRPELAWMRQSKVRSA